MIQDIFSDLFFRFRKCLRFPKSFESRVSKFAPKGAEKSLSLRARHERSSLITSLFVQLPPISHLIGLLSRKNRNFALLNAFVARSARPHFAPFGAFSNKTFPKSNPISFGKSKHDTRHERSENPSLYNPLVRQKGAFSSTEKSNKTNILLPFNSSFAWILMLGLIIHTQTLYSQCYQQEYKAIISLAQNDLKARNYQRAINRLLDAQSICPDETEAINTLIKQAFTQIEGEKQTAERQKIAALTAKQQAEKEKTRADSTLAVANRVLDQMYFYKDKFGLTLKNLGDQYKPKYRYGFIDKQGNEVLPFEYEEATPFSNTDGYARVSKEEKSYLLDTTGTIYLLAESIEALTAETQALDIHELRLDSLPANIGDYTNLQVILAYGGGGGEVH